MKQLTLLFCALFCASILFAQSEKDVFTEGTETVFYGLDFSKAKLIGSHGFTNPKDVKERFFVSWNSLLVNEYDKYDFGQTFAKKIVKSDLDPVTKQNEAVNHEELVINESYSISKEDVQAAVKAYPAAEKPMLGLALIVESFSKTDERSNIWVTFFNTQTLEVVHTQKYESKPGGFGLRNYWAGSIYRLIKDGEKSFKKQMKAYSK